MAFTENPLVDKYSESSEESVNVTKPLFSQKNGFLVREETPDKGVDFDVELILDNAVSGFKFAIQLKSVQKLTTIVRDKTSYVCYQFKTSRLGYLIRRKPGLGLLVIYDDANQKLYFDYVENIYTRIMEEHNDDKWHNNESVIVHIDCKNILDDDAVRKIYEKMRLRHLNFNEMYSKSANDFELPTFSQDELKDPLVVLEKYGYFLLNEQNYQIIYSNLREMTTKGILQNGRILLLAAITYYQIGYHADGEYYFKKCARFLDEYTAEEKALLYVCKSSSDLYLGNIGRVAYAEELERHLANVQGKPIAIFIKLKLLFSKLCNLSIHEETPFTEVFNDVEALTKDLFRADVTEDVRCHYMLEIASFIHEIGIQHFLKTAARTKMHRALLGEVPFAERLNNAQIIIDCVGKPQVILESIIEYAKNKNEYLFAVVLFKKCYMLQSFILQSLVASYYDESSLQQYKETAPKKLLESHYHDVLIAHDLFIRRMDYNSAYKCLTVSMETNYLYSFIYSCNIDDNLYHKATASIVELEKDLDVPKYNILAEDTILNLVKKRDRKTCDFNWDLSENKKSQLVKYIMHAMGLPDERAANILFDIDMMYKANEAINRNYFEVLQGLDHTKAKETFYKEKPVYVIRCKGCGYETIESNDLDSLLQCLRVRHGHICL